MSCFIALASAIANTDASLRENFSGDVKYTADLAFGLVKVGSDWQDTLNDDQNSAVIASQGPTAGAGAEASAWDFKYQADSKLKDNQQEQWQTLTTSNGEQINNTSNYRKSNFSLMNGLADTEATVNNLIIQFR